MGIRQALRTVFTLGRGTWSGLPAGSDEKDPIELFRSWYAAAEESGLLLPEAMTLATANAAGVPSARMVLLKGVSVNGFRFFTNYESRKAGELDQNPRAALVFHWAVLQRQVRVEGVVERLSHDDSEAYFRTRARGSRIGAWASRQSRDLPDRSTLEGRVAELEKRFPDDNVPLPEFWGGYRVIPERIEFWQGRVDRLHDRQLFERDGDGWTSRRLYP